MLHMIIYGFNGYCHGTIYEEFSIDPVKKIVSVTVKDGVEFDYEEVSRVDVYFNEKLIKTISL